MRAITPFLIRRAALWLAAAGVALVAGGAPAGEGRIVFFGDSLTAGYGLENPAEQAYPALLQKKISAERLPYRVFNAGLSGDTTAGGLRRINWVLREPADIFLLALGGNDGLRGIDPAVTEDNLQGIIDRVRTANPAVKIILAGMQMPANMGEDYRQGYLEIFPRLAARNGVASVPFLLEGVGVVPELNQPDLIHPNARGAAVIAETVWPVLRPLLGGENVRPRPAETKTPAGSGGL